MTSPGTYLDHIGLWRDELTAWVPDDLFDAHVHLGPYDIMQPFAEERLREALCTFRGFTYEECRAFYRELYSGKRILGQIAFGFPLREVDIRKANDYLARVAQRDRTVHPFILADPHDIDGTIAQWRAWRDAGVRFAGVKPYYDLLRIDKPNSVFHCRDIDFTPLTLLEFMQEEKLALMLHTSGRGGGDPGVRDFVFMAATRFPSIRIILAHMGRYTEPAQFQDLFNSDVLHFPNVFLEMSSASSGDVYRAVLSRDALRDKLIFGSDVPFGLLTGVEHGSDTHGPVFITRDTYTWSDPKMQREFRDHRERLTYNTYHVIKALKDAMDALQLPAEEEARLKERIFTRNVQECVLNPATNGGPPGS